MLSLARGPSRDCTILTLRAASRGSSCRLLYTELGLSLTGLFFGNAIVDRAFEALSSAVRDTAAREMGTLHTWNISRVAVLGRDQPGIWREDQCRTAGERKSRGREGVNEWVD